MGTNEKLIIGMAQRKQADQLREHDGNSDMTYLSIVPQLSGDNGEK